MINRNSLFVFLLISLFSIHVYSQNVSFDSKQKLSNFLLENPAEKIYMHTDRELYSENDTVWFKIYLSNAQSNIPVKGLNNVYVELISSSGEIAIRNLIAVVNGFGKGDLVLPSYEIPEGDYRIRAYLQYQRNLGDEFIFSKTLRIKAIPVDPLFDILNLVMPLDSIHEMAAPLIDIQFLPEGGTFVEGIENTIAFKAVDASGKPKEFSGHIEDDQGNIITHISSVHDGMGKVSITPLEGTKYTAVIDGYKNLEIRLPEISGDVQLSACAYAKGFCNVFLQTKEDFQQSTKFYLAFSSSGIINKVLMINVESRFTKMNIPYGDLTQGVNQITLCDSLYRPLAERLVFIRKSDPLSMVISTNKKTYSKRENVDVALTVSQNSKPVFANLSVSVLNTKQVPSSEKYPQNIVSYLLLNSELKGKIENPSFYFKDDSMETYMNLDLVMLTHGWRKYTWNNLASETPSLKYEREEGLVIKGKVKRLLSEKGAEDGKVTIMVKTDESYPLILETTTNDSGNFSLPPSIVLDSSSVFVQGLNKRNKKNTEIEALTTFTPPAPVPAPAQTNSVVFIPQKRNSEKEFVKMAYKREMDDKVYHPEKHVIMIGEVTVTENEISREENSQGYGVFDDVVKVDSNNVYSTSEQFIIGIPGVQPSGNDMDSIIISGVKSIYSRNNPNGKPTPARFLLNGMEIEYGQIKAIPIEEIDRVEVLRSLGNTAVYGPKGAGGIISVITKSDEIIYANRFISGILADKIRGYYKSRDFYSPSYEEEDEGGMPDHRATIYWNPFVLTDSTGTAKFSFYTSDDAAPALIKVEGITNNGVPGVGFLEINMDGEK